MKPTPSRTSAAVVMLADTHERELPERQLAGPTGEHRERQRDERVEQHTTPRLALRRQVQEHEREERDERHESDTEGGKGPNPPLRLQRGRNRSDPRRERPASRVGFCEPAPAATDQQRHEHDHEEHEIEQPALTVVVVGDDTLGDADRDTARERERHRCHAADERGREDAQQHAGSDTERRRTGRVEGTEQHRGGRRERPETTQTIVDIRLMLMPERRAASAFAADARIASPYLVRFMKSVSAMTSTGMTTITVSSCPRTNTPPISHEPENAVGYGPHARHIGQDQLEEQQHLRGTDQRDEQDHAGRGEEPAHDQQLERGADDRTDRDARDERDPERRVPVDDEPVQQGRREPAHLPDREVDDPVERNTRITPTAITPYVSPVIAPEKTTCFGKATASIAANTGQRPRNTARARSSRAASSAVDPVNRI